MTAKQTETMSVPVAVQSPNIPTLDIPLDKIVPNFDFNSRRAIDVDESGRTKDELDEAGEKPKGKWTRTYKGVDEMVGSFQAHGQLQPIKVRPLPNGGGNYAIIFGFRRYMAARALGWKTIKAQIESLDDKTAHTQNTVENLIRESLTPYEIATSCLKLKREFGITGADIARKANRTKSYVNNLVRAAERLHPVILEAWGQDHPLTGDVNEMIKLAALGGEAATDKERHRLQMEKWEEWQGHDEEEAEGEGESTPKTGPKRPNVNRLKEALSAVKSAEKSKEWKEGAQAALKFALGVTKTIPGVYDPDAKDE